MKHRDACAIIAFADKRGRSTHANIVRAVESLRMMGHRSGGIDGEGDGCGISLDIPREIWARRLDAQKLSPYLSESRGFFVAHILIPFPYRSQAEEIRKQVLVKFASAGLEVLIQRNGGTRDEELGFRARTEPPLFWQVAGMVEGEDRLSRDRTLFRLRAALEREVPGAHVASLSLDSVVYKLRGMPELLFRVYPELLDEDMRSVITLGHSRYSTNTLPTVERAQPFSLLGHNGEINTIERLRHAAEVLDIPAVPQGSDSQDLNRVIEGLIHLYRLDALEALEMVFPAIHSQVDGYSEHLQRLYAFYRWFFPVSAQGPAAVVLRHGDLCMGSVDALGLRPLWFGESDYDLFLSSEKGVVDLKHTLADPRPLAPGEKIALYAPKGTRAEVLDYGRIQDRLTSLMDARGASLRCPRSPGSVTASGSWYLTESGEVASFPDHCESLLAAFGWQKYDMDMRRRTILDGRAPIGSLGFQGPLACLRPETLPNVTDFFQEDVAVVTNPAIDRERESEHFSTRIVLGNRPDIRCRKTPPPIGIELDSPLILCSTDVAPTIPPARVHSLAAEAGSLTLEELGARFTGGGREPSRVKFLDTTFEAGTSLSRRLDTLCEQGLEAVRGGAGYLVLDDASSFQEGRVFIDPALATAALGRCLTQAKLRRETSLVVRSGAVRNLHDIMVLLGLGADGIVPSLIWRTACALADERTSAFEALSNTMNVLRTGIERVMSTMGIHELSGYGRIFTSIGLSRSLARLFDCRDFPGSAAGGLDLARIENMAEQRLQIARGKQEFVFTSPPPRNRKAGKIIRAAALGGITAAEMSRKLAGIDRENPVAIRHLLDFAAADRSEVDPSVVDLTVGTHSLPVYIAAMSFGSQGENSFRAYALAAKLAGTLCMNGEGGEIPDMLGGFRGHRGQQIASGRFGVFVGLLNSADVIEIKIGQGAKPGEGGHLPGSKVSGLVARARRCTPGITLISPSNNHDIYSIEDLHQIITELKTANPKARISIKIPVTSGIGTIAVGIAKAGADIITVSGYEGGTGAAREHAKKHVGLPVEIGVVEAHKALIQAGLRTRVELWCDGGLRSGADMLKLVLLGADRLGIGTAALMAIGCISCERCHLDRCPRGISTQIQSLEEAKGRGVKGYKPRETEAEARNLARLLAAYGEEMRIHLAALGLTTIREAVGRCDLLVQTRFRDRFEAEKLLAMAGSGEADTKGSRELRPLRRPLNHLTRLISDLAMDHFRGGDQVVRYTDEEVRSTDRALGTHLAGAMERSPGVGSERTALIRLENSVPGNGLCAFIAPGIKTVVLGGTQDGAAKGSAGGGLSVLRGTNLLGRRIDGSVGKSFGYGATGGLFMVQNYADSRACVRFSGADAVFGARLTEPLRDDQGNLATRAHLKGFAFEYMTGGRIVVLGDPGPWICSGMTGGRVYQCLHPNLGLDEKAVARRLARGAAVDLRPLDDQGIAEVQELLEIYCTELEESFQEQEAAAVRAITADAAARFLMILPKAVELPQE
ncbi:MAG: glutamate synthase-related protein [Desulfovibrionales bacterium]